MYYIIHTQCYPHVTVGRLTLKVLTGNHSELKCEESISLILFTMLKHILFDYLYDCTLAIQYNI